MIRMSNSALEHESLHIPRMMVARPRAVPIPLPLIAFGPTRLNLRMKLDEDCGE